MQQSFALMEALCQLEEGPVICVFNIYLFGCLGSLVQHAGSFVAVRGQLDVVNEFVSAASHLGNVYKTCWDTCVVRAT